MKVKKVILIIVLGLGALGVGFSLVKFVSNRNQTKPETKINKNKYIAFNLEVYDIIQKNYWEKIADKDLSNLFLLSINKLNGKINSLASEDKSGVEKLLDEELKRVADDKKKEFSATLADMVLANLLPFERSRLYSQTEEIALSNNVDNRNPTENYLENLGISKGSKDADVQRAFEEKTKEATSSEEKAIIKQSFEVLKNEDNRKIYENSGVEPTIEWEIISPNILHLHQTKFSPTTLDEFARVTVKVNSGTQLDTLIYDLRGNVGGAIDGLPYFLGPFIGPNTYAYQFYQQGNYEDFKTLTGWMDSLVRYKKVVILIDENSQSTAEVMAAVLKKYNVGVVVGTISRGWGTVERVFPITNQITDGEKFSVFLVHHVTLRDDGQPIEGRGVDPVISIKNVNWQKELLSRYNNPEIVRAIEKIYSEK